MTMIIRGWGCIFSGFRKREVPSSGLDSRRKEKTSEIRRAAVVLTDVAQEDLASRGILDGTGHGTDASSLSIAATRSEEKSSESFREQLQPRRLALTRRQHSIRAVLRGRPRFARSISGWP
jgi:hypothetical protein